jgi:acetyl-CoA carboxylase alpha subunit
LQTELEEHQKLETKIESLQSPSLEAIADLTREVASLKELAAKQQQQLIDAQQKMDPVQTSRGTTLSHTSP